MDRRATLNAPPERVWPWLLQLGKGRAGWYLSRRLERVVPRANRALREIDPRFQEVAVGDRVADYGRDGWFEARVVDPPHTLVWWSERGQDLHLTWALVIEASGPETQRALRPAADQPPHRQAGAGDRRVGGRVVRSLHGPDHDRGPQGTHRVRSAPARLAAQPGADVIQEVGHLLGRARTRACARLSVRRLAPGVGKVLGQSGGGVGEDLADAVLGGDVSELLVGRSRSPRFLAGGAGRLLGCSPSPFPGLARGGELALDVLEPGIEVGIALGAGCTRWTRTR
jgi:hypothetical protein